MKSTTSIARRAAVAVVLAVMAGCGASSRSAAPGSPAAAPAQASGVQSEQVAVPTAEPRRSIFEVMPGYAEMAMGVNLLQLRSSPIFTELLMPWMERELGDSVAPLEAECGIDFFTAVHSMMVAGRLGSKQDAMVMARGIQRSELVPCLDRVHGSRGTAEVVDHGVITQVRRPSKSTWVGWLDSATLLVGPEVGRGQLEQRMRGIDGLAGNAAMMELIDHVAIESGIWMVMRQGESAYLPAGIEAIYGTVNVVSGVELNAVVRVSSAEQASSMVSLLEPQVQSAASTPLGQYLASMELFSSGSDILVRWLLDDEQVADLMQLLSTDPSFKTLFGP